MSKKLYTGRYDAALTFSAESDGGRRILKHWFQENYFNYVANNEIGHDDWNEWFRRTITEMPWGYLLQFDSMWWRTEKTGFLGGAAKDDDCIWLEKFVDEFCEQFDLDNPAQTDYGMKMIITPDACGWEEFKKNKRKPPEPIVVRKGYMTSYSGDIIELRTAPTIIINDRQIPKTGGVVWEAGETLYDIAKDTIRIVGGEVIGSRRWKKINSD